VEHEHVLSELFLSLPHTPMFVDACAGTMKPRWLRVSVIHIADAQFALRHEV
jgi:hypothetical protein